MRQRGSKQEQKGGLLFAMSCHVTGNQSDDWPPLREADLDDIMGDEESESPPDSVPTITPDSGLVKREEAVKRVPSLRSGTNSNLKSGAVPPWLREEEGEEVEYERGQEDLGSIWLAELYMEGAAG